MKASSAFAIGLVFLTLPLAAAEPVFKAGAATSNITPEIGGNIIGGFVPGPSTQIHDELHARCLVLDDGTTKLALVVCDLLGVHRAVSDEARKLIAERDGIPRECVLISATHTHSATSALGSNRLDPEQTLDPYQAFVARRIADGVHRAVVTSRPAVIGFGMAEAPEHVFNRRWHMQQGTVPENPFGEIDLVKMNPPAGSPQLVEPAGPIDPMVSFLSVREPSGRPIALFAAYSLHYVGGVRSGEISSDYYGVFCAGLERRLMQGVDESEDRPPCVAIMANGTSGDINNINFKQPRPGKKPYEQMRFVADDVAAKVEAALAEVKHRGDVTLAAAYREPTIAYRLPTAEQKKWAETTLAAGPKTKGDRSYIYAERVTKMASYPPTTTIPLQVFRIGEVCIGTMPFEVFAEIGLAFKERSPQQPAFMVELAHGYFGYLPTPRQHRLGGYETWLGTNRVEIEASDKLLAELLQMAAEVAEKPAEKGTEAKATETK